MPKVTFIYGDEDDFLLDELSNKSADPKSLLIERGISILGICFLNSLVLKVEFLFHDLSQSYC